MADLVRHGVFSCHSGLDPESPLFYYDFGKFRHSCGFVLHFGEGVELEKYDACFV